MSTTGKPARGPRRSPRAPWARPSLRRLESDWRSPSRSSEGFLLFPFFLFFLVVKNSQLVSEAQMALWGSEGSMRVINAKKTPGHGLRVCTTLREDGTLSLGELETRPRTDGTTGL